MSLRLLAIIALTLLFGSLAFFGCDEDNGATGPNPVDTTCTISGMVEDAETDDPIADALIESDNGENTASADDGSFTLDVKKGNRTITVTVDGYEEYSESIDLTNKENETLDIQLAPEVVEPQTGVVSGTVTNSETEQSVRSVSINYGDGEVRTNSNGEYSIELEVGSYKLIARHDEYEPDTTLVEIILDETVTADFALTPLPVEMGTVSGRTRDRATGDPVIGARVRAQVDTGFVEVVTDENGAYTMDLPVGSYPLFAIALGYATTREDVEIAADQNRTVNFSLESTGGGDDVGQIFGVVASTANGSALSRATVTCAGVSEMTDQNGRYVLNVPPGDHVAVASKSGYDPDSRPVTVQIGQTIQVNFTLNEGGGGGGEDGRVVGSVIDASNSRPISGALISGGGRSTRSNNNGAFSFNVPSGARTIIANADGYSQASQNVNVPANGQVQVNFRLVPGGGGGGDDATVIGRVYNSVNSGGIGFATVTCGPVNTRTDVAGNYHFEIAPGNYTIMVTADGYEDATRPISCEAGQTYNNINIPMNPGGGGGTSEIEGHVRNANGSGISGATVASDDGRSATTGGSGYYRFEVLSGARTLTASAPGYRSQSQQIQAQTNRRHTVNFTLQQQ